MDFLRVNVITCIDLVAVTPVRVGVEVEGSYMRYFRLESFRVRDGGEFGAGRVIIVRGFVGKGRMEPSLRYMRYARYTLATHATLSLRTLDSQPSHPHLLPILSLPNRPSILKELSHPLSPPSHPRFSINNPSL